MNLIEIIKPSVTWLFNGNAGRVYVEGKLKGSVSINSNGKTKVGAPVKSDERITVRQCMKCKQTLPFTEFAKNKTGFNGRHSSCRLCRNAAERARNAMKRKKMKGDML